VGRAAGPNPHVTFPVRIRLRLIFRLPYQVSENFSQIKGRIVIVSLTALPNLVKVSDTWVGRPIATRGRGEVAMLPGHLAFSVS
jgi:hypothetical protein